MLTRYMGMSPKSQSYLFTFGLVLCLLAMVLTDMWLPIVAGSFVLTGLTVEAWIRVAHIIPMHEEMRAMKKQLNKLQSEVRTLEYDE
ncbi:MULTISPECIES: hypothetical protein [Vibrio]|uniref:hypothetical protein n=1 Tax=Vibrio TaxID=662 RepID=UPI00063DC623|nr:MULTISPECIES: hypothetical protein [Vibrio]ELA8177282.1 hypothetical protein [Vibrio alginolyticus]EMC2462745.1 hypothetical protein [Vibrio alginolyticus]KLI72212.1 NADH dehydrogenase [Vibrio alginolyticus]MCR9336919.1 hypothetical protein [Vibrio alginolyticus]MCR9342050.1 hypothetical protein [Vibrio alginolyticus]